MARVPQGKAKVTKELIYQAKENGIKLGVLCRRVYQKNWDPNKAAIEPVEYYKQYALYKGDELLAIGTLKEIAGKLGVKVQSLRTYQTPSYAKVNKGDKVRKLIKIETEGDEQDE